VDEYDVQRYLSNFLDSFMACRAVQSSIDVVERSTDDLIRIKSQLRIDMT